MSDYMSYQERLLQVTKNYERENILKIAKEVKRGKKLFWIFWISYTAINLAIIIVSLIYRR